MARTRDRLVTRLARRDEPTVDHFGRWLAVLAVAALVLRVTYILFVRDHPLGPNGGFFQGVGGDGVDYHYQALRNLDGHWFTMGDGKTAVALHPPGWTLVLTLVSALGFKTWLDHQMLGALIGSATVVAVGFAGRRIAGPRAGLIAAAIAVVYAEMWVYERDVLSEPLLMLGVAVLLILVYRFRDAPTIWRAAGIGALCGLLALTRSEQILLLPLLVAPLVLGRRQLAIGQRVLWLGLAGLCALIVLSPWTIFNHSRFAKPVVLSLGLGNAAIVGNCDAAYYGPLTGWYGLKCPRPFVKDESLQEASDRRLAIDYAKHHLGRLPVVMVARQGRAFGFWSPYQQTDLDSHWQLTPAWVNRLALWEYWLLLIPAVAGVLVLRRRRVPVYPLLVPFVVIMAAVAVTFGETRYRAPGEVPLVLLASVFIDSLLRRSNTTGRHGTGHSQRAARRGAILS